MTAPAPSSRSMRSDSASVGSTVSTRRMEVPGPSDSWAVALSVAVAGFEASPTATRIARTDADNLSPRDQTKLMRPTLMGDPLVALPPSLHRAARAFDPPSALYRAR